MKKQTLQEQISRIKGMMGIQEEMEDATGDKFNRTHFDSPSDYPQEEESNDFLNKVKGFFNDMYYPEMMNDIQLIPSKKNPDEIILIYKDGEKFDIDELEMDFNVEEKEEFSDSYDTNRPHRKYSEFDDIEADHYSYIITPKSEDVPEIPGFEGTMDSLNNLGIRK